MGSCICKQPNGLYCRYSSVVETMTDINMTFEDYVKILMERRNYCEKEAISEAKDIFENYLHDYYQIEKEISLLNETMQSRQKLKNKMRKSVHIVN